MKESRFIRYGKFALMLLICGIAGGIASFSMSVAHKDLASAGANLFEFFRRNAGIVIVLASVVLFAGFLLFYLRAKKGLSPGLDDDDAQRADTAAAIAQTIASIAQIFMITFMGFWMSPRHAADEWLYQLLFPAVVSVVLALVFNGLEVTAIGLQKKLTPGRKGDPLKLSFDRDWIESCDEAEKYVAYASAFRALLVLKWAFAISIGVLLLLQIVFGISFLSVIAVGVLWLIQTVTYNYNCLKYSRTHLS